MKPHVPSSTTLKTMREVTQDVGIKYETLWGWVKSGLVQHQYDVNQRPVFTASEVQQIKQVKKDREKMREEMRLPYPK